MQEVVILELESKPFLYVRSPPAILMARLDRAEPPGNRVQEQRHSDPDQVDGGKVESPPGWKRVESGQERIGVLVHGDHKNDHQSVYDVQVQEVEEKRHASKDDKETR